MLLLRPLDSTVTVLSRYAPTMTHSTLSGLAPYSTVTASPVPFHIATPMVLGGMLSIGYCFRRMLLRLDSSTPPVLLQIVSSAPPMLLRLPYNTAPPTFGLVLFRVPELQSGTNLVPFREPGVGVSARSVCTLYWRLLPVLRPLWPPVCTMPRICYALPTPYLLRTPYAVSRTHSLRRVLGSPYAVFGASFVLRCTSGVLCGVQD